MTNLRKSDWYGLTLSVLLHGALILAFAFMTIGASEQTTFGYIEVELGAFSEGRPVQRTEDESALENEAERQIDRPQPDEPAAPPETARPVDLPDVTEDVQDEPVSTPQTETISPVTESAPTAANRDEPTPNRRPVLPLGGGSPTGTSGAASGDEGEGQDERRTSPFSIEGLNRSLLAGPLPDYADKVNANIQYEITVDPHGRIVGMRPILKASPVLEQSIREAFRRWRFNALPSNAPPLNQTGVVTFRFRLE
ncbi:MAG TPA: energy transducer TonB [Rhodothermales bacterium]